MSCPDPLDKHWYHNLIANPMGTAEIGTATLAVRARTADSQQRRTMINAITAHSPSVAAAVRHTPREIPVVILELLEKREQARLPGPGAAR